MRAGAVRFFASRAAIGIACMALLIGDALACTQYWANVPDADPSAWSEQERFERSAQNVIRPYIRGVAYDTRRERAFISSCPTREFECDLLVVDLGGAQGQDATHYRLSPSYGYTWPSVSPDGRFLAVVRTPRLERPTQRVLSQELVEIDIDTGAEQVLASAGPEGRFERVLHAGHGTILVQRSYRSSPQVRCRGWFCTDESQLLIFRGDVVATGPLRTSAPRSSMNFIPVGQGRYWIRAAAPRGWSLASTSLIVEAGTTGVQRAFEDPGDAVTSLNGDFGVWSESDLRHRYVLPSDLPFCGTRGELSHEEQGLIVDDAHALFVMKRPSARNRREAVAFEVTLLRNRGSAPWEISRVATANYRRHR